MGRLRGDSDASTRPIVHRVSIDKLERIKRIRSDRTREGDDGPVIGSTKLYDEAGEIILIPTPTPDPKDPLNLPQWRKIVMIVSLAFFGALSLAAEAIIGALIPVFALEYDHIDPKILDYTNGSFLSANGTINLNPVSLLANTSKGGPSLARVALISTLPLLTNGIAGYLLVPLSIAIGRRPVIIICGLLAWVGGLWAGLSSSLTTHLAARAIQGIGAGAVESLIPLMVQDLVFLHQRNRAMSAVWTAQGVIIISIGLAAPIMVVTIGWRFIYFLTSGLAFLSWLFLVLFAPETRWMRSASELAGRSVHYIYPGEKRPRLDEATHGPRTRKTDYSLIPFGYHWKEAGQSMLDTLRTVLSPIILWAMCLQGIFQGVNIAVAQTASSVLIAKGWSFRHLGLAVIPIVLSTPFVWLYAGWAADKVGSIYAKRHNGRREPETHLITLILPIILGIVGCALYGWAGETFQTSHWMALLSSIFMLSFSFLASSTIVFVYIVESYPQWAGPVLVNVSSFRCIIGFILSYRVTVWVDDRGFLGSFAIYSGVLAGLAMLLPVLFLFGKSIRRFTSGTVKD